MLTSILLPSALLVAAMASGPPSPNSADGTFAIRATKVHVGDGTVLEGAVVVVEQGVVKSVGASAPDGMRLIDVDGHLSPGLIALRDATGADGEANESTRKMTPTADLSRAFDPEHPAWPHLVAEGITTVVLTPDSSRIAGGAAAIVSPGRGEVVKRSALVCLGLSDRSLENNVEPTSYAGLYAHLEKAFAEAPAESPLARAKAGQMPVLMEAIDRAEALRAIAFAKKHGLVGAILGLRRGADIVDELKESGLGVVFEPLGPGASRPTLESAVAFEKAGIPFAFTADVGRNGPSALRMTAAAFVRAGVSPKAALRALTAGAAEIAGVQMSHGTIAAGKVADLVIWSGDPTDLTSSVQHVFAGGRHVYDAAEEGAH